jgi:hypothetical protein
LKKWLSEEFVFRRESKTTEDFRQVYFALRGEPQQAIGASVPLVSSLRPFCISVQQSVASTAPLADLSAPEAGFVVQQLAFFSTAFATAFVGPQHAFASLQHAKPSVQHF